MSRFTAIPSVPEGVGSEWQTVLLEAMKENIELLTGQRGERDRSSVAITRDRVRVIPTESRVAGLTTRTEGTSVGFGAPADTTSTGAGVQFPQINQKTTFQAQGAGFNIGGEDVAALDDYQKLIADVTELAGIVNQVVANVSELAFPLLEDHNKDRQDITNLREAVATIASTLDGIRLPNFEDYERLVADVVAISQDLADLRASVNTLIANLRA